MNIIKQCLPLAFHAAQRVEQLQTQASNLSVESETCETDQETRKTETPKTEEEHIIREHYIKWLKETLFQWVSPVS